MVQKESGIKFFKMHGLGNDFVILDLRGGKDLPSQWQLAALTDRKTGVGCDQLITLHGDTEADVQMRIFNAPDAIEVEACGNATRCVGRILLDETKSESVSIRTKAGILFCEGAQDVLVTVDMGVPAFEWSKIPLSEQCDTLHLPLEGDPVGLSIGNPHCVFFVEEDLKHFPLKEKGPEIENHDLFPQKVNVGFVSVTSRSHLNARIWERDAGATDACGTGACAAAIAAMRRGLVDRKCTVSQKGGDLHFYYREDDNHIMMTGPATYVFEGRLYLT